MSLHVLKEELSRAADSEAQRILSEAEAEANAILEAARAEAQSIRTKGKEEALELAKAEERKLSSAKLRAKHVLAQAQLQVIRKTLDTLAHSLRMLAISPQKAAKEEYARLFHKLAKKALAQVGKNGVISCRAEDVALAKSHGTVSSDPLQTSGGLLVTSPDGTLRIDYTFESLLEEKADVLTQKAHAVLFKGTTHHARNAAHAHTKATSAPKREKNKAKTARMAVAKKRAKRSRPAPRKKKRK